MISKHLLELKEPNLSNRVNNLLDKMKDDSFLKEFVENPTLQIFKNLNSDSSIELPEQSISKSNELFLSVLKNKKFIFWLNQYQENIYSNLAAQDLTKVRSIEEVIDKQKIYKDLAQAIVEHGEAKWVEEALIKDLNFGIESRKSWVALDDKVVALYVALLVVVVVSQIDITPRSSPTASHEIASVLNPQQMRALTKLLTESR